MSKSYRELSFGQNRHGGDTDMIDEILNHLPWYGPITEDPYKDMYYRVCLPYRKDLYSVQK